MMETKPQRLFTDFIVNCELGKIKVTVPDPITLDEFMKRFMENWKTVRPANDNE